MFASFFILLGKFWNSQLDPRIKNVRVTPGGKNVDVKAASPVETLCLKTNMMAIMLIYVLVLVFI